MFGVFGLSFTDTVVLCAVVVLLVVLIFIVIGLVLDVTELFGTALLTLAALVIGGLGCTYIISQPDGYVGEAKYVENVTEYNGGSGSAVPIVEVEGKGRFPVDGSGIVSYEVGDMIPVECYFDSCKVK